MAAKQASRKCRGCGQRTLHIKQQMVSEGMGCLLTVITGGLFLIVWVVLLLFDVLQPWRCQQCGKRN